MAKNDKITNGERAMYAFFIATLAGPFFAAALIAVVTFAATVLQIGPPIVRGDAANGAGAATAALAVRTFIWAAMPAGLAGAMLAAWVSLRGGLPWFGAVVAGVVAFGIASVLVPGLAPGYGTAFAFVAAMAALGVWAVLRRANIVAAE